MKILAISGSVRSESTNTYFLREIARIFTDAEIDVQIEVFNSHDELPIFSQDQEGEGTPLSVLTLCEKVSLSNGIIKMGSDTFLRTPVKESVLSRIKT